LSVPSLQTGQKKTPLPAHTPAAHPKEDHLRFLAKKLQ
jgi:hypothetical protein